MLAVRACSRSRAAEEHEGGYEIIWDGEPKDEDEDEDCERRRSFDASSRSVYD